MSDTDSAYAESSDDEGGASTSWKYLDDFETRLRVDDAEEYLLGKARVEVDVVLARLRGRMYGHLQSESAQVGVGDVLSAWMDESVLTTIKQFVNSNLDQSTFVTTDELLAFVEVELWLGFYSTSPTAFFHSDNRELYPPAWTTITKERYMQILNALGKQRQRCSETASIWTAPLSHGRDLSHATELVRRLCSDIGFVEGISIASLDDDLLRLRSTSVDELGLAHVRNPKKGYGPVNHGIASITTGICLGTHVVSRGESNIDVLKILQRSLCGATTESQIRLPGIVHALDRGYQSEAVNEQIRSVGGKVVVTHKRTIKFPFTYGKQASRYQKEIELKGEKSAYWAATKLSGGKHSSTPSSQGYALAYRCGLGKVALCYTIEPDVGPGCWSYVCDSKDLSCPREVGDAFTTFEVGVQILTEAQRTPDWFLLRKFRATGSVVNTIFRQIAKAAPDASILRDPVTDPDIQLILMLLAFRLEQHTELAVHDGRVLVRHELEGKTNEELRPLCRERALPASGNKAALVDRLSSADGRPERVSPSSIRGALLSA